MVFPNISLLLMHPYQTPPKLADALHVLSGRLVRRIEACSDYYYSHAHCCGSTTSSCTISSGLRNYKLPPYLENSKKRSLEKEKTVIL
jgi:hypothetical protein